MEKKKEGLKGVDASIVMFMVLSIDKGLGRPRH